MPAVHEHVHPAHVPVDGQVGSADQLFAVFGNRRLAGSQVRQIPAQVRDCIAADRYWIMPPSLRGDLLDGAIHGRRAQHQEPEIREPLPFRVALEHFGDHVEVGVFDCLIGFLPRHSARLVANFGRVFDFFDDHKQPVQPVRLHGVDDRLHHLGFVRHVGQSRQAPESPDPREP